MKLLNLSFLLLAFLAVTIPTESASSGLRRAAADDDATAAVTIAPTKAPKATPAPKAPETKAPTAAATVAATPAPTVAATPAPTVAATPAPTVAATPAPTVAATPAPTKATAAPKATVAPTAAPKATDAPVATAAPTAAATTAPVPVTPSPTTLAPIPVTTAPTTVAPVKATTAPVPATVAPVKATTAPVEPTKAPVAQKTKAPTNPPVEVVAEDDQLSKEDDSPGGDDVYSKETEGKGTKTEVPYVPAEDDPIKNDPDEQEWIQQPVESPEEMIHDMNVVVAIGATMGVMLLLMVCTAHQVMNNPDGLCASLCRLAVTCMCCVFKIFCFPCRMCCGGSQSSGGRHVPMRSDKNTFSHDLELS